MSVSKSALGQATEQDLVWFKLDNYTGLAEFAALDWARLVGDRLNIRRAIDGGNLGAVAGVFESIKATPLKWLGSDVRYVGAEHAANTATVKSMNLRRMLFLADELDSCGSSGQITDVDDDFLDTADERPDAIIDELLATVPTSPFQRFAHVVVSIDAPRAQIVRDFSAWLDDWLSLRPKGTYKEGDYLKKAQDQWIPHCAVQYFDLKLYEALAGKEIPSDIRWNALFPGLRHELLETKKKKARSAAALAFSADTYRLLRHLAYGGAT
ncbi:DUF6387 family protein [Paraburkholderia hospita]|uniref:DUF6387 family protein n=1 Tax=Paraburkholderia hospita TaxID=169430 RepID=UPI0009A5CA76|nr:DUF6387 family protein [Paraburkholderia hospita]SKC49558.1 hypothetical protein SAMN05446934_0291 [Paraburkholderia hospita]